MYDMLIPSGGLTSAMKAYFGDGCAFVLDDHKVLFPQMNSGGICKVYAPLRWPENYVGDNQLPEKGKTQCVARMFDKWKEINREIIVVCDEVSVMPRKMSAFDPEI
jgi:hypothetical protein